jgi:hypothetical protein
MTQTALAQPKTDWYQAFRAGLKGRPQPKSTELDGLKTLVAQIAKELGALKQSLQKHADNAKPEFDPTRHLTKIQGKNYLEVKWRLVWMRSEHPDWSIETEPVEINTEKKYVIFSSTVKDETGRVIAIGTKADLASPPICQLKMASGRNIVGLWTYPTRPNMGLLCLSAGSWHIFPKTGSACSLTSIGPCGCSYDVSATRGCMKSSRLTRRWSWQTLRAKSPSSSGASGSSSFRTM